MEKDVVWMDYARFIGIFLVVFGHAMQRFPIFNESIYYKDIWNFIYLFHMPLFFVISGYFYRSFEDVDLLSKVKIGGCKIWYSLIVPYLLYQIIYLPFSLFQYRADLYEADAIVKLAGGILLGDGYKTPYSWPVNLPCWFILSIIQLRFLFMCIPINKLTSWSLMLGSIIFLYLRKFYGWDLYFCLDSTIMAIPYFIVGYYLAKSSLMERFRMYKKWLIPLCFIIIYCILYYNGAAQMNGPSYGKNILLNYLAGFAGTFMIFMIADWFTSKLNTRSYVRIVSRNTLFIIFFHWVLLAPCGIVIHKLSSIIPFIKENVVVPLLLTILLSVIVLHLSKIIIERNINKYPMLFGKTKK